MNPNQTKNDAITRQEDDFAQWYTDVCKKAELMDYSSVKGFIVYLPYGYAIWEEIQNYCNKKFKEKGAQNVYLPLVIPQSLFATEKEHVEGFAPECLVATIGGGQQLADPLIIRPTSEILFSELYRKRVNSYRDLPMKYNQWCSVVRWEKTTRPFLRGSEFLWQEGHCLFETEEEARDNVKKALDIYDDLGRDLLAIPFLKGKKTENEKFAGAIATYTKDRDLLRLMEFITSEERTNLRPRTRPLGAFPQDSLAPSSWSMAMTMVWSSLHALLQPRSSSSQSRCKRKASLMPATRSMTLLRARASESNSMTMIREPQAGSSPSTR